MLFNITIFCCLLLKRSLTIKEFFRQFLVFVVDTMFQLVHFLAFITCNMYFCH